MFPHEPETIVGFDMGDAIVDEEGSCSNPIQNEEAADDDDNETPEAKEDAISVISDANSVKSNKSIKRVQFLPDGILVRIREIPPRSNKSSSESDGSASESGSDSDDSDSESTTDSDGPSDRETPPPPQTVSETKFTTMPPLVWNSTAAKGSYSIAKQNPKQTAVVAKITGIHRPISPATSPKPAPKKVRRAPSPGQEKHTKRISKQNDKGVGNKNAQDASKKSKFPKKQPLTRKDGKASPPPHPKPKNPPLASKTPSFSKATLAQRRINSAPPNKLTTTTAKRACTTTVSTSVSVLPPSPETFMDTSVDRVTRAMQSISVGQLYTMDGFIFPSHQASDLHLPEVVQVNGNRGSTDSLTSPRKSADFTGDPNNDQSQHIPQQSHQLSPQSINRKKRYYAWQMANGSIQNTLQNTPSIAQLWDNVPQTSHSSSYVTSSFSSKNKTLPNGYGE